MKTLIVSQILALILQMLTLNAFAAEKPLDSGDVRIPLAEYQAMLNKLREQPKPPPAAYAIGKAQVNVEINEYEKRTSSSIRVETSVETFENQWTLIPILPHGAALARVYINGNPAQLVREAEWLSWGTNKAGVYKVVLEYNVDGVRSTNGYVLPLPIPRATATRISVKHPVDTPDIAIVPAADIKTVAAGTRNVTTASVPMSSSVLISWRVPSEQDFIISRAGYKGELKGDALLWNATYDVEIFTGETVKINLMPSKVTLNSVQIDNKPATIKEENEQFVAVFKGRGKHSIQVGFQVPVVKKSGPPNATVNMPRVPVSRFDLTLPGKKEVKVNPDVNVIEKINNNNTVATVYTPMSDTITFSWIDTVASDSKAKLRANANLYHSIHAEEGVLHGRAIIVYDITHGETGKLLFYVPEQAQVNQVRSASGGISDWVEEKSDKKGKRLISVFLNRKVKGEFTLDISYEQLTQSKQDATKVALPLLLAADMHRQRGMVALLAGQELALKPSDEKNVTKVGENQLPASIRNMISMTIAHTYKYTSDAPQIMVASVAPERKQGKYDAQADTLISLGEVTMKGSASVQVEVKSGVLLDLDLYIPNEVNVLNVAGPSIRSHTVKPGKDRQNIHIEFTQEMQGQFRLNINYEKILGDDNSELDVPTVSVVGAEVEHGRIAVEALTAVEVKAAVAQQLSTLDINELPQQLVLKTSNPILLAFKYVHADPPAKLVLKMTRHKELDVQVASIENANYQTLVTNDGLAVTTARFTVLNSRQQFLRLVLPKKTEVWSVFVNNQAEKPAHPSDGKSDENVVLIKMINSSTGFQVEMVYATEVDKMGTFGSVATHLPQPDMVVTKTRWDLFMPVGANYHSISTNMNTELSGVYSNPQQLAAMQNTSGDAATKQVAQPLRVNVPTEGIHFAFTKLYANKSDEVAQVRISYVSGNGDNLGVWLSIIGALLLWGGIFLLRKMNVGSFLKISIALLVGGLLLLIVSSAYLHASLSYAANLSIVVGIAYALSVLLPKLKGWFSRRSDKME